MNPVLRASPRYPVSLRVAFSDGEGEFEIAFPEATVRTQSRLRVDSTAEAYTVSIELTAYEDGQERFSKRWDRTFPRDGQ